MADIISFQSSRREEEVEEVYVSSVTWSPLEAVKDCYESLKSKELEPSHVYIAMMIPEGEHTHRIAYIQAGVQNLFETVGLLKIHADYHASKWQNEDEN